MAMGRPVGSGSLTDGEGGIRAYLHVSRLKRLAQKLGGHDGKLLEAAATAMQMMAAKNRRLNLRANTAMQKVTLNNRGASFARQFAAEAIAELAADGPVTAYVGRNPDRIRVMRNGRVPRGARLIGVYNEGCDYRDIQEDLAA